MTPPYPCTDKTALFYSENFQDQRIAKELCHTCPFEHECYELGLVITRMQPREPGSNTMGIWGGVNMKSEHARIKKQFYRQRKAS